MFKQLAHKLHQAKSVAIGTQVLAPNDATLVVIIDGLRWHLRTTNRPSEPALAFWAIMENETATFIRKADDGTIRTTLSKLPRSPFIWLGNNTCHVFNLADSRFTTTTLTVENPLGVEADLFTTVEVAFWGQHLYAVRTTNRNRVIARELASHWTNKVRIDQLQVEPTYKSAYAHVWGQLSPEVILEQARQDRSDPHSFVRNALNRGGAELVNLTLRQNNWVVEYRLPEVDSHRTFQATFNTDFQMITPGLCFRTRNPVGVTEFVALVRDGFQQGHGDWSRQWLG